MNFVCFKSEPMFLAMTAGGEFEAVMRLLTYGELVAIRSPTYGADCYLHAQRSDLWC